MGACCFKSTAVPETSEGDTPQDELALNSLPTSDTSNDPEQTNDPEETNGEVTSKEEPTNNEEEEARSSNDSSITEPVTPLEYGDDNDEYLIVEDKKCEDELMEEQTIISPLPSPYQTFPFSVDEPEPEPKPKPEPEPKPKPEPEPKPEQEPEPEPKPEPEQEPEPQVEEKSIEKPTEKEEIPQEEVITTEDVAKDESITRGELVLSSSLISYDIISEVDPKSYDASSKKVKVTEKSNGSNTNEEATEPEEQKYTSFKKDTMNNKRSAEDKYKTEVVTIENDEFVSVDYK